MLWKPMSSTTRYSPLKMSPGRKYTPTTKIDTEVNTDKKPCASLFLLVYLRLLQASGGRWKRWRLPWRPACRLEVGVESSVEAALDTGVEAGGRCGGLVYNWI